jgi:sugar phosphate isomerase/epimerase
MQQSKFSISTHWNAHQHASGEAMIDEILALGVNRVELGYDLTMDLVPGVEQRIRDGAVTVSSVHNYCPVPIGVPQGHPELFLFSSPDRHIRERAVSQTVETAAFAARMGAGVVVVHAGRVEMPSITRKLVALAEEGRINDRKYDKLKMKLLTKRDRKAVRHREHLYASLEAILPSLDSLGITIALEILPSWEAMPSESEMFDIANHFNSPRIRFWYDTGHGKIRDNLGIVASMRWLDRLQNQLAGMHLHDVVFPAQDHVMPPHGDMDFSLLQQYSRPGMPLVLEPAAGTPVEDVAGALEYFEEAFSDNVPEGPSDTLKGNRSK